MGTSATPVSAGGITQQGHRQSRRFLDCIDNFLLQVIEEPMSTGAMMDLVLTNKKGLVGNMKLKDSLGALAAVTMKWWSSRSLGQ